MRAQRSAFCCPAAPCLLFCAGRLVVQVIGLGMPAGRLAREVQMTLGMCRGPLHRPLPAGAAGRGTSPARQKSATHLRLAAYAPVMSRTVRRW
jgi:hypothetical protein